MMEVSSVSIFEEMNIQNFLEKKNVQRSKSDLAMKGQKSAQDYHLNKLTIPPIPDALCQDTASKH